ncbi:beta-ketoacyl synthase [Mycolicibacterium phlei]|nr:hybrid non-ribosomal peptide synthetase/type I polyketide synthase [Mycolicibacterium phlei]AMO60043.1 Polyketide synthase PksJ [Mycolicibacterium phlei]STZ16615.1 beta-ketoacyl synthase [Mycolicibacterium phlei]VEG08165.1 beta-ketoacyl synthase [Mycobacteroides chelonae]
MTGFIAARDGRGETIQDLFAEQVAHTPDRTAIVYRDTTLTYARLDACANRLAARLLEAGVRPGDGVAVLCERTPLLPIALLAVLKVRGHYIPLDPAYPVSRIDGILDDARPVAVVTDQRDREFPCQAVVLTAEDGTVGDDAAPPVGPGRGDDLVYSIYTSGSTGRPKGTLNYQRGAVNLNRWMIDGFGVGPHTRFLVMTSIGFDITSKGIFSPLLCGGTVVLYDSPVYDPARIRQAIVEHRITSFQHTPTAVYGLLEGEHFDQLAGVEHVLILGEALRLEPLRRWLSTDSTPRVVNGYGPTECADMVAAHEVTPADLRAGGVCPLGTAIPNVTLTVRDADLAELAPGEKGELCIQGVCVGAGYRNLPEQTAAAFVDDPHTGQRLYRTGDLVSRTADGLLLYHGRMDAQVKIRGHRVELGEVEQALDRHPGVRQAVVTAPERPGGERFLAAYIRGDTALDRGELSAFLAERLPDYMVPASYTFLDEFPVNASFKVDRKALPAPVLERPELATPYRAPRDDLERRLAGIFCDILGFDGVGVDDPFFEVGGNSLLAARLMARVNEELGTDVPVARFFETATIAGLAAVLRGDATPPSSRRPQYRGDDIAIVGVAARVPGADDAATLWRNLLDGVDALRVLSAEELELAGVRDVGADYVPVSGWAEDTDAFDHEYFGYTPYEAERIDPQQRLLLELAATAFDDAGLPTAGTSLRVGIYAGLAANTYLTRNVLPYDGVRDLGLSHTLLGNDKDYAATRIAHKLGFTGPAMTVQTACSSSGTAIHLACQALREGDCDVALAGGASLPWQFRHGYPHVPDGALSADGRVRAFDADATGMVLTGGGACLVLRRLQDALADGHTVYAVIRATALTNDGAQRASFTAPSVAGQRDAIRAALDRAGVDARSIGMVEAHGTGTALGDPIEVTALTQAWREDTADTGFCAIGSVKSNIGHLDAAAASVGAIKLALALRDGQIPATLHVDKPNPACEFETSPFFVNTRRRDWSADGPRRGALSSFGFGGTNFHAILEQATRVTGTPARRDWQVLRVSAKTGAALSRQIANLREALESTDAELADISYTLDVGRNHHPHRAAVVARSVAEARDRLATAPTGLCRPDPRLVFTFPGQGAQHPGMGRRLYETESVFRAAVNECAEILAPVLDTDLRSVMFDGDGDALRNTQLAQPAIFTISYATARLWQSWGLTPDAMVGHSVGEYVAATLAGVFELEHALLILAERARLMQSMPPGGMLAVRLSEDDVAGYLADGVAVAAVNAPTLTVLSGPHPALSAVRERLAADGVACTPLHTSHAFHSPMMDPIVEPFAQVVARYPRSAPRVPFYSSLTGLPITEAQATDPHYWAQQVRGAVRFAPAITHAVDVDCVVLECGPGQNLTTSTRQTVPAAVAVASLPHAGSTDADDAEHLGGALAQLYTAGVRVDAQRFHAGETRRRVSLPPYPFERTRHWIGAAEPVAPEPEPVAQTSAPAPVCDLIAEVAGVELSPADEHRTFLELGFDSLLLTQLTTQLNQRMRLSLRFRQLIEEFPTPAALAQHLDSAATTGKVFGAGTKITTDSGPRLTPQQREALDGLIARYTARTANSRAYAEEHRPHLADPRAVSGFHPLWKDLVYPIVAKTSKGPRFTDIDGNTYVDLMNGFGSVFFGHRPDFVVEAVHNQIESDIMIGPQNALAGECARMFAEMTGHERAAFCNTGSEAVLAAIRLARTVTGRNLIVQHEGDYHGIVDEVLVRGTPSGRSIPAAAGVPPEAVANTIVLEYGSERSLQVLRERAHELAAVVIEPVQSRKPDLQPADYVREVRRICDESGTALIMDEVVCGFRVHWAGAQGVWGVKADIACYGKVFGAGMPVGAVAGSRRFMDALDGGQWRFGDDSMPEVGVTYFAGTFVRHPMTMAVVHAALTHMRANPHLQEQVNERARSLVDRLNAMFAAEGFPMHIGRFGSLLKPEWTRDVEFGELFYYFLREAGVYAWDGRPNYLTTEHGEAEIAEIVDGFAYAIGQMKRGGFLDDIRPDASLVTLAADEESITVPSTESQREVWLAARFVAGNSLAYNEGVLLRLDGALDEDALRAALQTLLDRHESLRAHFSRDGRSLIIKRRLPLELPRLELSEAQFEQLCAEEMGRAFDLRRGPLVRFTLVRLDERRHRLVFIAHHAVCDGWSAAVLLSELGALYSAAVEGRQAGLPEAPRYADYVAVERHFLESSAGRGHREFWLKQLHDAPAPPQLPPDRTPGAELDLSAARVDVPVDPELVAGLRRLGGAHGASLVATMLTGFAQVFRRCTDQDDLVIGLAAAGQSFHGQGQLVGHCVNLLPLRLRLQSAETFAEALATTRDTLLDAYDHQGVSFGTLLPDLALARSDDRPPLVSVVFNIDVRDDDISHTGLAVGYETMVRQAETFELFINVVDTGSSMVWEASYRTALYSEQQIREHLAMYEQVLREAVAEAV